MTTAIQTIRRPQVWVWMLVSLMAMLLVLPVVTRVAGADSGTPREQPAATTYIISPSSGTFLAGAHPGAEPYVSVGSKVETGTVLGNVEVWGQLHPVQSMLTGTIVEVLVNDDTMVKTWQPLFKVQVAKEPTPARLPTVAE
jgi:biotin carboxyl carrier protein